MRKNIDAAWFQEQAGNSPLVRSIHGAREFTLSEIEQIANLINVPILEVLRRCGVDLKAGCRPRSKR